MSRMMDGAGNTSERIAMASETEVTVQVERNEEEIGNKSAYIAQLEYRLKESEASAAAMREAIETHRLAIFGADYDYESDDSYIPEAKLYRALSTSAGKERSERLERLESVLSAAKALRSSGWNVGILELSKAIDATTQALKSKGE
jgi:hypothetical protein